MSSQGASPCSRDSASTSPTATPSAVVEIRDVSQKTDAVLGILHSRRTFVLMIPSHFLPVGVLLDQEELSCINASALKGVFKAPSAGFGEARVS